MIYKGVIYEFDINNNTVSKLDVMYRIFNFDNIFFFAEEISTGCIFPVYNFYKRNDTDPKSCNSYSFFQSSYLKNGRFYAYFPLEMKDGDMFKYSANECDLISSSIYNPSIVEVNKYLDRKRYDWLWQRTLKKMEESNLYQCDLSLIKEKITLLKDGISEFRADFDNVVMTSTNKYEPIIDLSPIADLGYNMSTRSNLCNLVGREEELKRIIKMVAISGKSVLLLGESGSGKTAIVEKLALDIKNGTSEFLDGKIIFCLDLGNLTSGTKYRGEFEEKLKKLITFCIENKGRIILFIDEIHNLLGMGRADGNIIDAMNILKPYISNGDLTVLGATTNMEYERYMSNDPAFLRRFENVEVSILDKEMNIKIMLAYIEELKKKYRIRLTLNYSEKMLVLKRIYDITNGKCVYASGNVKIENPTLSKNILENAFTEALYKKNNAVTMEEIEFSIQEYDKLSLEFISEFGYDLSKQDNLCNLVGREKELEKVVKAIGIKGSSVLLVGEPGTGKTSIAEKLALDIKNGTCEFLDGKVIFSLDVASLTAGTKHRGEFEERMNKIINICKRNKGKIILFIDEIHSLYGLGRTEDSSMDAMNILKPHLTNGNLTILGATTNMEYEKYMSNDPAFLRRNEVVEVSSLSEEDKIQILVSYANDLEVKYNLKVDFSGIDIYLLMQYIVKITELECQDVNDNVKIENPTISKRLLENAFINAKYNKRDFVMIEDIFFAIMDCEKLTLNFKKECASNLKAYINDENKHSEIYVPRLSKRGKVGFNY